MEFRSQSHFVEPDRQIPIGHPHRMPFRFWAWIAGASRRRACKVGVPQTDKRVVLRRCIGVVTFSFCDMPHIFSRHAAISLPSVSEGAWRRVQRHPQTKSSRADHDGCRNVFPELAKA